jgi:tetratricopeptide (TPR) repeat protein
VARLGAEVEILQMKVRKLGTFSKALRLVPTTLGATAVILLNGPSAWAETWQSLYDKGCTAYEQDDYKTAEKFLLQASKLAEPSGERDSRFRDSMTQLGLLYESERQFNKAQEFFKRALSIEIKQHGKDSSKAAILSSYLGGTYVETGRYEEAKRLCSEALKIERNRPNDPSVGLLITLEALGRAYFYLGDFNAAEQSLTEAINIEKKSLAPTTESNYPELLNTLGGFYVEHQDYDKAIKTLNEALAVKEKKYPQGNISLAITLNNLGNTYRLQGKLGLAKQTLEKALAMKEKFLGNSSAILNPTLDTLGQVAFDSEDYSSSEKYYRRELAIDEHTYGLNDPKVAEDKYTLAVVLRRLNKPAEAELLLLSALAIKTKIDPTDPGVGDLFNDLGSLYESQNHPDAAAQNYQKALTIYEKKLPKNDTRTYLARRNLGAMLSERDKYPEAEKLFKESLADEEKIFGPDDLSVARDLALLAGVYNNSGRYQEAQQLYERSLKIQEKQPADNLDMRAQTLENYSLVLNNRDLYVDAQIAELKATEIRQKLDPDSKKAPPVPLSIALGLLLSVFAVSLIAPLRSMAMRKGDKRGETQSKATAESEDTTEANPTTDNPQRESP